MQASVRVRLDPGDVVTYCPYFPALEAWRRTLYRFLQRITFRNPKRLVLKSPPHTCRIRLILEMFPDARFVHIHREPYVIYQSTRHLHLKSSVIYSLQPLDESTVHAQLPQDQLVRNRHLVAGQRRVVIQGRSANSED